MTNGGTRTKGGKMRRVKTATTVATAALIALVLGTFPALAQGTTTGQETATVTFELTIRNEVPEGRTFGLGYRPTGNMADDFEGVSFCTTDANSMDGLPPCEVGETYSGTLEVPMGVPFTYDYMYGADADVVRCDYIGPTEIFYSDTQTFTGDATVSATYTEDGLPAGCRAVGATPDEQEPPDQYEDPPGPTPDDVPDNGGDPPTGKADRLPDTGGAFWTLGVGVLLLGAGLLASRLTRG
jgi:hypothetical protein